MSNEEIVARIQAGEEELCGVLWEQVERLVAWKTQRVIRALDGYGGVEFGDLYNSCYPALLEAIKTYNPATGAFSTWFMYYVKTAFAEAMGYRTVRTREDPLHHATSLSQPIGEDEDDGTLSDVTPDPQSQSAFESAEAEILFEQIREALAEALAEIPADQSEVLQQRFFERKTLVEVGEVMEMTAGEVRGLECKGLRAMRQPRIAKKLRPLYEDFDFYSGSGLGAFRSSGMSIQERYLIRMERQQRQKKTEA